MIKKYSTVQKCCFVILETSTDTLCYVLKRILCNVIQSCVVATEETENVQQIIKIDYDVLCNLLISAV